MKISLRRALELAVADWFDGHNWSGAADLVREALRDQPNQPAPDAVPHDRPDTSLRSELMAKLATQREVLLNLCDRVDRLEMRADGLTPIERVQRRWAKEAAGPAAGAEEPTPPAEGEVGELVAALRADAECIEAGYHDLCSITGEQLARAAELLDRLASPACVVLKPSPELIEAFEGLPPGRIEPLPDNAQVIEPSNRTILVPAPVPVPVSERLPVDVEQALIKAECALSDIAEGEPEENEGDADALLQWAEQRAATALSRIRPVMRLHGIHTSEWPPLPANALPLPQQETPND